MTWTMFRPTVVASTLLLPVLLLGGCGALDVSDPTAIEDEDVNNATGADLMRKNALSRLASAASPGALSSGMFADEFLADPAPFLAQSGRVWVEETLDRRQSEQYEALTVGGESSVYANWHGVRRAASAVIPRLRIYLPESPRSAYIGQMLAVRGFATLRLAEDFCPGFPLHDVVNDELVYGPPRTTAEVFQQALADFDSATVYAADSARFLHLARLGQARTLVGLGRFAEAAAAVASVPTDYAWSMEYGVGQFNFALAFTRTSFNSRRSVADREGGTGLDYLSANDPRVTTRFLGLAYDGVTGIYAIAKYPNRNAPIVLASGIEARLIEAEAALRAGQPQWLTILNELRTDGTFDTMPSAENPTQTDTLWRAGSGGVAGLRPLTDPGSEAAQVDLLFRERAFWLFATGHRLADLRRLVQHYGRTPETVFPTRAYRLGGLYDAGTSIPFPAALETPHNPAVTGCTSR